MRVLQPAYRALLLLATREGTGHELLYTRPVRRAGMPGSREQQHVTRADARRERAERRALLEKERKKKKEGRRGMEREREGGREHAQEGKEES